MRVSVFIYSLAFTVALSEGCLRWLLEQEEPEQPLDDELKSVIDAQNCSNGLTGVDVVFMFPARDYGPDEVMTIEAYDMVDKFIDRFQIGDKPGRARFAGALTQSKAEESFSISTYSIFNKESLKMNYRSWYDPRKSDRMKNDHAKVTMEAIIPDLKSNVLPDRKGYRIVFQARNNHPNADNGKYTYAESAKEMENLKFTTFVIAYYECSPYMAHEVAQYKNENVYTIGTIRSLGSFKVLEDIYTRILNEQECIAHAE